MVLKFLGSSQVIPRIFVLLSALLVIFLWWVTITSWNAITNPLGISCVTHRVGGAYCYTPGYEIVISSIAGSVLWVMAFIKYFLTKTESNNFHNRIEDPKFKWEPKKLDGKIYELIQKENE